MHLNPKSLSWSRVLSRAQLLSTQLQATNRTWHTVRVGVDLALHTCAKVKTALETGDRQLSGAYLPSLQSLHAEIEDGRVTQELMSDLRGSEMGGRVQHLAAQHAETLDQVLIPFCTNIMDLTRDRYIHSQKLEAVIAVHEIALPTIVSEIIGPYKAAKAATKRTPHRQQHVSERAAVGELFGGCYPIESKDERDEADKKIQLIGEKLGLPDEFCQELRSEHAQWRRFAASHQLICIEESHGTKTIKESGDLTQRLMVDGRWDPTCVSVFPAHLKLLELDAVGGCSAAPVERGFKEEGLVLTQLRKHTSPEHLSDILTVMEYLRDFGDAEKQQFIVEAVQIYMNAKNRRFNLRSYKDPNHRPITVANRMGTAKPDTSLGSTVTAESKQSKQTKQTTLPFGHLKGTNHRHHPPLVCAERC